MENSTLPITDVAAFAGIGKLWTNLFGKIAEDPKAPLAIIAGGCFSSILAGRKIKDVDVFSDDSSSLIALLKANLKLEPSFENNWVCNFKVGKYTVQIVKGYEYVTPVQVVSDFDFTIVCAAYDGKALTVNTRFFIDNAQRKLVINNLPKPLSTMQRMVKYASRGYAVCPKGLAEVARAINLMEINWADPDANKIEFYPDGAPKFLGLD